MKIAGGKDEGDSLLGGSTGPDDSIKTDGGSGGADLKEEDDDISDDDNQRS